MEQNNPDYYKLWDNFEVFDVMKKILTQEEFKGYLKGCILKYQFRLGKKSSATVEGDLAKIERYKKELEKLTVYDNDLSF